MIPACPPIAVATLGALIPAKWIEALEQNQLIASCCRHPENHTIEAQYSHADERAPNIYIFHCDVCGRKHRRFMCGQGGARPYWEVR